MKLMPSSASTPFLIPFCIISFLFPSVTYSGEAEYRYPELTLRLKGNQITLQQNNNIYSYPPPVDVGFGIVNVLREDLNGNGKLEYIVVARLHGIKVVDANGASEDAPEFPYCPILICEEFGDKLVVRYQIDTIGTVEEGVKFLDINGDGIKDLIAEGGDPLCWHNLKIVTWYNGKFVLLWDKGIDNSVVEQVLETTAKGTPQIKVKYYTEYGKPEEWESWVWNGNNFYKWE